MQHRVVPLVLDQLSKNSQQVHIMLQTATHVLQVDQVRSLVRTVIAVSSFPDVRVAASRQLSVCHLLSELCY